MNRIVEQLGEGIYVISVSEIPMLAVKSPYGKNPRASVALARSMNAPGMLYRGGNREPWNFSGVCEIDGSVFYYGPLIDVSPFHALFKEFQTKEGSLDVIRLIGDALRDPPDGPIYVHSILANPNDGMVLFLPPPFMKEFGDGLDIETRESMQWDTYLPRGDSESGKGRFFAFLTYGFVCGRYPDENSPPPLTINTALDRTLSDAIFESLREPAKDSFEKLLVFFGSRTSIFQDYLSDDEQKLRAVEADRYRQLQEREKNKKPFFRSTVFKIVAVVTLIIIAGTAAANIAMRASRPSATAGLSEIELIERYYTGINNLDFEMMDECLDRRVAKQELKQVQNLFVIAKVRQAYEGMQAYTPAEQWLEKGMPELSDNPMIFGIIDIEIDPAGDKRYKAGYVQFQPSAGSEESLFPEIFKIEEEIELEFRKDTWQISSLVETGRKRLSVDEYAEIGN